jgi:hypothetical protein
MRSEWIQPLQEEESSSFLESLGLQDFDRSFTSSYVQNLTDAAAIGINRESEPTMNDGGLYALPTGTPPLLIDEWERVPEGKRVIIGAFGGTNWITEIGEKSS